MKDWRDKFDDNWFDMDKVTGLIFGKTGTIAVNKEGISQLEGIKDFIENLLTQAKAEQRGEDARIAENQTREFKDLIALLAYNKACDDIAKEIRNQKED